MSTSKLPSPVVVDDVADADVAIDGIKYPAAGPVLRSISRPTPDQRLALARINLGRGGKQLSIAHDLGMSSAICRRRLKQASACFAKHL